MLNTASIHAVDSATFGREFRRPLTESYCFSKIPGTIEAAFGLSPSSTLPEGVLPDGLDRSRHVIMIVVDGFGWRFVEDYGKLLPFIEQVEREGVLSKLTSQFPSTTACHMTSWHSGLPVAETGIYEWYYYEPLLDDIVAPLSNSFANRSDGTLTDFVDAETLFPFETIYTRLAAAGIPSVALEHKDYAFSPFSTQLFKGATVVPFRTVEESFDLLATHIRAATVPTHFALYIDTFDSLCHRTGPKAESLRHEALKIFSLIEKRLVEPGLLSRSLLLLTADHGAATMDPRRTMYVDKLCPEISEMILRNRNGALLAPAGSARNLFLHIAHDRIRDAISLLESTLHETAEVYATDELIAQGIFGSHVTDRFRARVGSVVALPYDGESVYWWGGGRFEQKFVGHHGGLAPVEMEIPLLAYAGS